VHNDGVPTVWLSQHNWPRSIMPSWARAVFALQKCIIVVFSSFISLHRLQ